MYTDICYLFYLNNYNIIYNDKNLVNPSTLHGIVAVPTDYLSSSGTPMSGSWIPGGNEMVASPRYYNFVVREKQAPSGPQERTYIVKPHIVEGECKQSVNNTMLLLNDHLVLDSLFQNFFI